MQWNIDDFFFLLKLDGRPHCNFVSISKYRADSDDCGSENGVSYWSDSRLETLLAVRREWSVSSRAVGPRAVLDWCFVTRSLDGDAAFTIVRLCCRTLDLNYTCYLLSGVIDRDLNAGSNLLLLNRHVHFGLLLNFFFKIVTLFFCYRLTVIMNRELAVLVTSLGRHCSYPYVSTIFVIKWDL